MKKDCSDLSLALPEVKYIVYVFWKKEEKKKKLDAVQYWSEDNITSLGK